MIKKILLGVLPFIVLTIISCKADLDEIETRLDELDKKVESLASTIKVLEKAYSEEKHISSVVLMQEENMTGWQLEFTDHTTISIVDGISPYFLVDENGFWCISYDGGNTYKKVLDSDNNFVKATGVDGENGVSVRVEKTTDGYYSFILYKAGNPNDVVESIKTPLSTENNNIISSICEDEKKGDIIITTTDGRVFNFKKEEIKPTSIAILRTGSVFLSKNGESSFEFRVNPSNAVFNYDLSSYDCEISIDKVGVTRSGSYVTVPDNYELSKVETVVNTDGTIKRGQYKATVRDLGKSITYKEQAALVLSFRNNEGVVTQVSSSAINIEYTDKVFTSFSLLSSLNPGVIKDIELNVNDRETTLISPYVVNLKQLRPSFETNGKVYVDGILQKSGVSIQDFTKPVKYEIESSDGTFSEYIIEIKNTGLPTVVINTPNSVDITSKTVWTEGVELTIFDKNGNVNYSGKTDNIKGRGNSTWTYPKKPYAIKLNKKAGILGHPKHKRWCLLANWRDRTVMRNSVSLEIAKYCTAMGWSPSGDFVELIFNGNHVGNYYLCEQIKVDENRVNIAELNLDATEGEDITGGFIMELDNNYDEEFKFMSQYANLPYMFKDPDVINSYQFNYMKDYINNMEKCLYDSELFAERKFADYMDLESFADWFILHELVTHYEAKFPRSVYAYKDKNQKLKAGPAWDYDCATFRPDRTTSFNVKPYLYYPLLFKDKEFVNVVKKRWAEIKPKMNSIPEFVQKTSREIEVSESLNHEMWPVTLVTNWDESYTFKQAVDSLLDSFLKKLEWLDKQIQNM